MINVCVQRRTAGSILDMAVKGVLWQGDIWAYNWNNQEREPFGYVDEGESWQWEQQMHRSWDGSSHDISGQNGGSMVWVGIREVGRDELI